MEATGIGAIACGRHGCFIPHSVVDFQKGERYVGMLRTLAAADGRHRQMNIDYSLSQALTFCAGIRVLLVMYDVACQYRKKVQSRFNRASSLIPWPVALIIYWGIGLFHIHGHQQD